jgi:hypothetical protein
VARIDGEHALLAITQISLVPSAIRRSNCSTARSAPKIGIAVDEGRWDAVGRSRPIMRRSHSIQIVRSEAPTIA